MVRVGVDRVYFRTRAEATKIRIKLLVMLMLRKNRYDKKFLLKAIMFGVASVEEKASLINLIEHVIILHVRCTLEEFVSTFRSV